MVKHCANPNCGKPLRYLREGRIFVFETKENDNGESIRRMEHFWLCGTCSKTLRLEMTNQGVQTVLKREVRTTTPIQHPLAS
ncbi:MAG TPA: hypothetical protein VMD58_01415 [Acidobacteriaceae bacterium]|nr:hypothetical protein [Acidobacteriaceae bacterium]